jgi:hypothetical protein
LERGFLDVCQNETCSLSDPGWQAVRRYYNLIAGCLDGLTLKNISSQEIDLLLLMDRCLVDGVAGAQAPYDRPVLHQFRGNFAERGEKSLLWVERNRLAIQDYN